LGIEPTTLVASTPGRAAASVLLVLGVAAGVRYGRAGLLDRAVDATLERPLTAPLYGVAATVLGGLLAAYVLRQALRLGVGGRIVVALVMGGAVTVAGFGFVVVGTGLTTIMGNRRPWAGPLVGAGVSALVLLALPGVAGLVGWVGLAATGVGGSARRWLYASRAVERNVDGGG
jgi:hypothetical protein